MLPFPFKQIHNILINQTGFCVTPINEHLVSIRQNDIFLVSYPKSGNTWLRFILSNLLYPESQTDFKNVEFRVPDIHNLNGLRIQQAQSPRILKSHFPFKPEYPKVIYIVRDPKSVAVSEYYYLQKVGNQLGNFAFNEFFQHFMKGHNSSYGSWGEHVNSWIHGKKFKSNTFKLIRYEDLKASPEQTVGEIVSFLGLTHSNDYIQSAIQKSSFNEMRKLESQTAEGDSIPFVRKSNEQEGEETLTAEQKEKLYSEFEQPLRLTGYL